MFHILPGSTPAVAPSVVSEDEPLQDHEGSVMTGDGEGSSPNGHNSAKRRSRRRRKGKSRTKVEPFFSMSTTLSSSRVMANGRGPCNSPSPRSPLPTATASPSSYYYNSSSSSSPTSPTTMSMASTTSPAATSKKQHDAPMTKRDLYFALDCEMVGVGQDGLESAVGRVTIVNWENQLVLDTYVKVPYRVTDFRTYVSGVTAEHLLPRNDMPSKNMHNQSLMSYNQVREQVQTILRGKILIGHGLENDLVALSLTHPWCDIRDTATYSYFMRDMLDPVTQQVKLVPRKLRDLTWDVLKRQIQMPGKPHSPVEDAIAALELYKASRSHWEDHLIQMARHKEKEQQQQLMERQRRQQLQQQQQQQKYVLLQQQQQQQQQQLRRWQWFAASSAAEQQRSSMYAGPPHLQQPHLQHQRPPPQYHHHPAPMSVPEQAPAYQRYANPPMLSSMVMPVHSPAASAYLTGEQPRASSSWFGFSRRPAKPPVARLASAPSYDSTSTQPTVPLDTSYSQDPSMSLSMSRSRSLSSTYATQQFHEHQQHSPPTVPMAVTPDKPAPQENSSQHLVASTAEEPGKEDLSASVEKREEPSPSGVATSGEDYGFPRYFSSSPEPEMVSMTAGSPGDSSRTSTDSLPKEYKAPLYFTSPDPDPLSPSSWFKLWSRGSNGKLTDLGIPMTPEQLVEEKAASSPNEGGTPLLLSRRKSESARSAAGTASESNSSPPPSSSSYSLFSTSRLFPRRKSESCMEKMTTRDDTASTDDAADEAVASRSLH